MSVLILVLFVGLFLHDALIGTGRSSEAAFPILEVSSPWLLAAAVILPKLLLALLHHLLTRRALAALNRDGEAGALRRLERWTSRFRQLLVASYLSDLFVFGALQRLRESMGDLILIDELILLMPPLLVTMLAWISHHPVDVKLREATFMSRLDRGLPVQMWTRGQFILAQVRHQWALMGIPFLLLSGWSETVQMVFRHRLTEGAQAGLMLGGSLMVFLFTPLIIRYIWDTTPLPAGPMRDRLLAMCRQHRVGVRELLLWRTYGGMINGAVMGFVRPMRYILLTDALLESMPAKQVEAVMAHELAHVRRHHMLWMFIIAAASVELIRLSIVLLLHGAVALTKIEPLLSVTPAAIVSILDHPEMTRLTSTVLSIGGWFLVFGWVSRRFERQADTFAAQHLAHEWHAEHPDGREPAPAVAGPAPLPSVETMTAALERGESPVQAALPAAAVVTPPGRFPPFAAHTMAGALQSVADLNYIPVHRPSWRHGSIAWRQAHLRTLPGTPIDEAGIDRQVVLIKWTGAVLLLLLIAVHAVL